MPMVKHFRDLDVYKGAMSLVMEIFALSKQFPSDERFTLTDQIRRSSRSICANIAEAWRKRRCKDDRSSRPLDHQARAC
ncbi:MAG TPA: four helix bundle protein [Chthoniobacterales bacterium]